MHPLQVLVLCKFLRKFAVGVSFCLVVLTLVTGCGYRLRHQLKNQLDQKRAIFVPIFDNETDEVGLEQIFTNALIRELQSRRELVVGVRNQRSLELRGRILSINYNPVAFTDSGLNGLRDYKRLPSEYAVEVTLYLQLYDPKKRKSLWVRTFRSLRRLDAPVDRTFDYQIPSALALRTESLIENIYPEIARNIMRDVYDDMVELF